MKEVVAVELAFTKMNGLGNDFIVIEDLDQDLDLDSSAVVWLCDRHFGVGADGVILVRPAMSAEADYAMHYVNADGSVAEMCGNGARCFAKYLVDHGLVSAETSSLMIETLGGIRPVRVTREPDGTMATATVDMGKPVLETRKIPVLIDDDLACEYPLETPAGTVKITAVSMGNPHAVIWVDDIDEAPVDTIGPLIETHPAFPHRTNVEFAELVDQERIRLRVWERGCGETLACGTGACATLVAAALSCRTGRTATIELPGGELFIEWDPDEHVYMTGSAAEVFRGAITLEEDDER
ncbi:MAG: diaminopimelate epimerase [Coriobacteriales bacterium]